MAQVQDVVGAFGSRKVEQLGGVSRPHFDASMFRPTHYLADEAMSVGRIGHDISRALDHTAMVLDRRDEREAEYAVMRGTDFLKNGFNGVDSVNDQGETVHTPGIVDKTWQDFRNEKTDSVKSTEELIRSVREQDFYQDLSPAQKRKFDRAFLFKENEVRRLAADHHGRLALAHKQEQDKEMVAWNGDRVAEAFGADDATYAGRVRWAVSRNFAIAQGTAIANPEILDDPNCDLTKDEWFDRVKWTGGELSEDEKRLKKDLLVKMAVSYDLNRVEALTKAAAGNRGIGAGPLATPEGCLMKAAQIANGLNGNGFGVRPDGTKKGTGWCGILRNANGELVTEFSMQSDAVKVNGERIDFPTLVPGLTKEERQLVLDKSAGKEVDAEKYAAVEQKAVDHAKKMIAEGKSVWRDSGTGAAHINDAQRNALLANVENAAKDMRSRQIECERIIYNGERDKLGMLELDLLDPEKISKAHLDYAAYRDRVFTVPGITQGQKIALVKEYAQLVGYKQKYDEALAKHQVEVADKENKRNSQYGWFKEDGSFVPAIAFPKDSDGDSMKEFNEESAVWQNPKTAMARLEAARMTGRLSEADYKRYYAYGTMMMDKEAQNWWLKNYGRFDIPGLTRTEYGETDVKKDIRKSRQRGNYSAASGIFAANRGVGKAYESAADFVADTLENDREDGNETLVPLDVLPKVYDTVRRFARAGVDPADAVRAILQPALQEGIRRDITERLSDPDYFNAVVEDYKEFGTHFTETANADAAAGRGGNWRADRNQAVTSDLLKQGRVKKTDKK